MVNASDRQAPPRPSTAAWSATKLLEHKLTVTPANFRLLHRARVTRLLDRGTAHRVTLVCAPPGSGKTVACASWARARLRERRIAWLSVDGDDNNPERFVSYVAAALHRAQRGRPNGLPSPGEASPEDFSLWLLEVAEKLTEPVILVLDDAHELTDGGVLKALAVLCERAPATIRVVLSGRYPPPLHLARLWVSGELVSIGAADLACTPPEADTYFQLLGLSVSQADRDELLRHTRGWMAGLRLADLHARAPSAGHGSIAETTGETPIVADYLRDEVLARQDPPVREFLLRTSVVRELTDGLADELGSTTNGARFLDRLRRQNCFVEAVEGSTTSYRYHPLLREMLRAELRREVPHEIPLLLRRASAWYAGHGMPLDALRSAIEAADWSRAAQVLADSDIDILISDGPAALEHALAPLPPDLVIDDATVAAALAAARLWAGDEDGALPHLDSAETALDRTAPARRRVAELKLVALRVMQVPPLKLGSDALEDAWNLAQRANTRISSQPGHRAVGLLWFALGMAHLRRFEVYQARQAMWIAGRQLTAGDCAEFRARARAWWAVGEAWHGNLRAAEAAAHELVDGGQAATSPAVTRIAGVALAVVNLMRDELTAVHRLLGEIDCRDHAELPGESALLSSVGLLRSAALIAQGDVRGARASMIEMGDRYGQVHTGVEGVIAHQDIEIALRTGDPDRVRANLERLNSRTIDSSRPDEGVLRGRLLLAAGDPQGALEAVEPCLDTTAGDVTMYRKLGALLVAAVAHRRLSSLGQAAGLLRQALALAEPEGACRAFLDGGQAVRSALTVFVSPASHNIAFARKILDRFDTQMPVVPSADADGAQPLTNSELAVMRFLPSHLTNEEIGDALFLSVNTVKTHLRSAYRKLGVASRREAVALARHRGLV